jgi:hypothetical protein
MAQRNSRNAETQPPISRGTETGAPPERPPIPDPLGDDEHVAPSGHLTSDSPDHEGLLRSGTRPLPDGGVEEHPTHDEGYLDDLGPEDYEAQFDEAPKTGFVPSDENEGESADTEDGERAEDAAGQPDRNE